MIGEGLRAVEGPGYILNKYLLLSLLLVTKLRRLSWHDGHVVSAQARISEITL